MAVGLTLVPPVVKLVVAKLDQAAKLAAAMVVQVEVATAVVAMVVAEVVEAGLCSSKMWLFSHILLVDQ
jgi:hypothetical protein